MLKYFAILFMVLDHTNKILFQNEYYILTLIGRLAYPIFAYLAVYAYMYHTSNKLNYILRLFAFAIIAHPFHMYALDLGIYPLNILFSLSFGLLALYFYENKSLLLPIPLIAIFWCDYSYMTLLLFFGTYYFIKENSNIFFVLTYIFALMALNFFEYMYFIPFFFLLLAYFHDKQLSFKVNKYAFYIFYPFHFFLLGVLK